MRSTTPLDLSGHCPACWLRFEGCVCAELPKVEHRTEVFIVRHSAEARLTSNTGRLASLALTRCKVVEYSGGAVTTPELLPRDSACLVYPVGKSSVDLREVRAIVVLDGSFHQARRMYRRVPELHRLPALALPAPDPKLQRLRQPTRTDGMSTIEAIASALALIEGEHVAEPLRQLFQRFVRRSDAVRGRVRGPAVSDV